MRYYCDFGWRRWTRFVPPDGWIAIESDCHLTAPSEAEGTGVARRRAATDGGISDVARFFYTVSLFCFLWLSRFRLRSSSFFFLAIPLNGGFAPAELGAPSSVIRRRDATVCILPLGSRLYRNPAGFSFYRVVGGGGVDGVVSFRRFGCCLPWRFAAERQLFVDGAPLASGLHTHTTRPSVGADR